MRRVLKFLVIVLLLAGLAYAGLKGVMYWRVKQAMDSLVNQIADQAQVSYGSIDTDLRGSATVRDIKVHPQIDGPELSIDQVTLSTGSLKSLLLGFRQSGNTSLPSQLSVHVLGLHIPLNPTNIAAWKSADQTRSALRAMSKRGCDADGLDLGPEMLKRMGFSRVSLDADFDYHFDKSTGGVQARADYLVHQVQSGRFRLELTDLAPEDLSSGGMMAAKLVGASLQLTVPRAFGDHYMQMCADAKHLPVAQFHDRLVDRVDRSLAAAGVKLGPGLQKVLGDFYRDWGKLSLQVRPAGPLGFLHMMTLSRSALLDALGARLAINGVQVTDLSFDFDPRRSSQQAPPGVQAQGAASGLPQQAVPQRYLVERTFVDVPVSTIDQQIGKTVRIITGDQPVRQGVLTAVVNGDAVVGQDRLGGQMSIYVSLGDIKSLQVQQVRQVPQ